MTGAKCPWQAASVLLLFVAGCGAQYRPVVTPVTQTGPASQPSTSFVALSAPSATSPGLATLIDGFGQTVLGQAALSNNPFAFALSSNGGTGYSLDGNEIASGSVTGQGSFILNSYTITAPSSSTNGLRTLGVNTSTIDALSFPFNEIWTTNALYLIEPYINPATQQSTSLAAGKLPNTAYVGEFNFSSGAPALQQEIGVAPNPVNFAGTAAGPRLYVISQGNSLPTGGPLATPSACNTPSSVTTNGEVDSLEVTTNTISTEIPVGICPVFGIESPDFLRAFILNRGSGNITVINAQSNAVDATIPGNNGSPTITTGAGPVYADLYSQSNLLVTANYDSNTVSIINIPTDIYDNDAPNFGTVTTIPVGNGPVALTILRDGSRAYVANQKDGTVSVVNLLTFKVTKTISLPPGGNGQAQPRSIASVFSTPAGAVYVASPNSNTITVINTETDTVSASVLLPANAVSVSGTTQNASANPSVNSIVNSNSSGFGVPCAPSDISPFCAGAQ
jgi:YVTN family beta-propeller protein